MRALLLAVALSGLALGGEPKKKPAPPPDPCAAEKKTTCERPREVVRCNVARGNGGAPVCVCRCEVPG